MLQTRPALERPGPRLRVGRDGGEEPTKDVVLLDHLVSELPLAYEVGDLSVGDHAETSTLIRRPHRGDRLPPDGSDGSSSGTPEVKGPTIAAVS